MKKLFLVLAALTAGLGSASAQIYRPSVVGQTTVLGAVAGALIGGHNHDRWAEGAIIGAAAGAVVGAIADDQRQQRVVYTQSAYGHPGFQPVATVPCAPVIGAPAPQVVYVNPAPQRVVYVDSYPAPVVVRRPVVYVSTGWGFHYGNSGYRHDRRHHHHHQQHHHQRHDHHR